MTVSSTSASSNAYAYLQSLLQQGSTNSSDAAASADPISTLLAAFYPAGNQTGSAADSTSPAGTGSPTSGLPSPPLSPDTLGTLISLQGQQSDTASQAQSLFGQFDTNGDGQISKSEFESAFGPNADTSKVDGLFSALDGNGDGSVSQGELTSAAQQAKGHHHHHMHGGGSGQSGGLADLLTATSASGATTKTATNADGTTTTTLSYADGTTISMTAPAGSTDTSSSGGSDSQSGGGNNVIEQLIRLQSEMLAQSATATAATTLPPPVG
jgi:hypothetical protein